MSIQSSLPSAAKPAKRVRGFRPSIMGLLTAVLLILGTTVFLYPYAAQWVSQARQSAIVSAYEKVVDKVEPDEATQIKEARKYNEYLAKEQLVDIEGRIPTVRESAITPENLGLAPYKEQLLADNTGLMARIRVPSADIDLPVYHGTSDVTLLRGAGHLQGTALPIGGEGTRTVITAHRGLADSAMFTYLDRADIGDTFSVEVFGELLVYKINDIKVVPPEETETIRPVPGKDLATLITCTPLGINTHRIVVTGERILPTPASDLDTLGVESDLPRFPWWVIVWFVVFSFSLWFVWFTRRENDDDEPNA
ncbi:class C sortase [Arcanobacterium buesumense]|uniref:Class C sortase n=1 Tax=Arcanobacterium buesumense TaxID=2722751 RepID=A0A6H2EKC0_9ACTO|nr:class C sortase [Arcanobacterium buesumense]QJC21261.1 class C sortase [Arcanobacterium buesumense]